MVATVKSAKNKEVQLIQETERNDVPKIQSEVKQVRKIVPTMIQSEPMETTVPQKENLIQNTPNNNEVMKP